MQKPPVSNVFLAEYPIKKIKNNIIDKIILATLPFGIVASSFSWIRDELFNIEYNMLNVVLNYGSLFAAFFIFFYRYKLSFKTKTWLSSSIYFLSGIRFLFVYGFMINAYVCLIIACMIAIIDMKKRYVTSIMGFFSIIILLIGGAYASNLINNTIDYNALITSKWQWISDVSVFMLIAAIIVIGNGQYVEELIRLFKLLTERNNSLQKINSQLKEEIESRKAFQQELGWSEKKFKTLFESSLDGILLVNENGSIAEANPAFFELTGFEEDDLSKISVFDMVDEEHTDWVKDNVRKSLSGEFSPPKEMSLITKSGERKPIEVYNNILVEDKSIKIFTSIRDISVRKGLEDQKFNAIVDAQEKERNRFSRDLHDDLGPLFSTVKLYVESLHTKENDPEKLKVLEKLSGIVNSGVKQIREVSHNLSPQLLYNKGLKNAMNTQLKRIRESSNIKVNLEYDQQTENEQLNPKVEIMLYRTFQELLNNSIRHAKCDEINVKVISLPRIINLSYMDNGIGFSEEDINKTDEGIGLRNVINRVHAKNGSILFKYDNHQMKIDISIPL